MNLKKALLLLCALSAAVLSLNAQPVTMSTSGNGYFYRGSLMQDLRNYVGSSHQLNHLNKYLLPQWNQEAEAEYIKAVNEFELGNASSLTMLEDFIENYANEPLAVAARAKVGDYYFYRGEFAQALANYQQVREKALDDDTDENVLYRRAYCDLMLENYEEAKGIYDKLAQTKQYGGASTFFKAYIEYANGNYNEAFQLFDSIDRTGELGYQSQYYMCQILYKQGEYSNAARLGTSLIEDNQNDYFTAEMNRIVGESKYRLGDLNAARPYLTRFLETCDEDSDEKRNATYMLGVINYNSRDYDNAINNMQEVATSDDAMTQSALLYIGQSRLKSGDYSGAAVAFERAANMHWDNSIRETAFYNYAISQSRGGRTPFNKSIDMFEKFLNEYPNSAYYNNVETYLIDAYSTTNDYDRALASIANLKNPSEKVLKAKQNVLYRKGVQQLKNNKPSEAARALQQALNEGNKDNTVYNDSKLWLAEAQYQMGDYANAAKNQQEFVNSVKQNDANYGLAQYNLGSSLFNQQEYAKAIEAFQSAIESNSLDRDMVAEAYNRMGDARYYGKDFDGAVDSYTKAVNSNVESSSEYAMLRKAIIAGDKSDYESKIEQLDELMRTYPTSTKVPEAMLEKGNAQVNAGKLVDAINTYSALIKNYPNHPESREAMLKMALAQKSNKEEDNAIDTYWNVIEKFPASNEAKTAAQDLKLIYADRGELGDFTYRLNGIEGGPKIDVRDVEKAAFEAAETYYIDNESIYKLENYLRDYPDGAYMTEAMYYIGHYYYSKHDYNSAMEALNDALEGNEDAAFAQRAMALKGTLLLEQGRGQEAMEVYKTWATKATNNDNYAMAQMGIVRSAREAQDWETVVESADILLESGYTLTSEVEQEMTLARALANIKMGKVLVAQSDLNTLAANIQSEAGAQAAYEIARLQYESGDLSSAEKSLDNLIGNDTDHVYWVAKGFILLCDIYNDQGNQSKAVEYLISLKNNYPGNEGEIFNEIENRLNEWQKGSKK